MENKKEIGQFVKDKLINIERVPSDNLWTKIEQDLDSKKRPSVLFWLFPMFLTFAVILTFLLFPISFESKSNYSKKDISNPNPINNRKTITYNVFQNESENHKPESNIFSFDALYINFNNLSQDSIKSNLNQKISKNKSLKKIKSSNESINKTKTQKNPNSKVYFSREPIKLIQNSKKLVKSTPEYDEYEIVKKYTYVIKKKRKIISSLKSTSTKTNKRTKTNLNLNLKKKNSLPNSKLSNIKKSKKNTSKSKKQIKSKRETHSIDTKPPTNKTPEIESDSVSGKDIVTTNNNNFKINNDSISKDSIENIQPKPTKKELFKKVKKNDSKKTTQKKQNIKYFVSIFYGPTTYGLTAKASTPNNDFNQLEKKHPITSYYGLSFRTLYGKIGYRVGLSKINLSITNKLNNGTLIPNYNNIALNEISSISINEEYKSDSNIKLVHDISYYEIPFEFYFSVLENKNKFNLDIFTGFSVLINDDNSLYLLSDQKKEKRIGHVENLSHTNSSFNIGLGISYNFYKDFYFDCNPVYKYYISSFDGNKEIKPYSISLQTGITYKF